MKTKIGTDYAAILNADSLQQIAQWCDTTAKVLTSTAQEQHADGRPLKESVNIMSDAASFQQLAALIRDVLTPATE